MNHKILILLAVLLSLCCLSCYDDEGSYDYHEINEVNISNWRENGYMVIYKSDTLRITPLAEYDSLKQEPVIEFTQDQNPDRYEYEWKVKINNVTVQDKEGQVIGTERNLVFPVTLEPNNYTLYLKVKDKETDLVWISYSYLYVMNVMDKGFLLLGEDEAGNANLDMISMSKDTIILKNLLNDCGLPTMQNPKRVMYTGTYSNDDRYVWITTADEAYYLDPDNLQGSSFNVLKNMIFSAYSLPDQLIPLDMSAKRFYTSMNMTRVQLCENYVFAADLYSPESYGNPVNRLSASSDEFFKPYPHIFTNAYYPRAFVLYDETDRCFTSFSTASANNVTQLKDKSGDIFPWQQPEGRNCIYGENTYEGGTNLLSVALMEDADNFYIYKFLVSTSISKRSFSTIAKGEAPGLRSALLYAFASTRTLVLYAEGNILHAYDYQNKRHYQQEMDGEITCMEFDVLGNNYDEIMIATYNEKDKGVVERFLLGSNPNTFELEPIENCRWTGLVKVKDIEGKF